jgi:hypothetical protein
MQFSGSVEFFQALFSCSASSLEIGPDWVFTSNPCADQLANDRSGDSLLAPDASLPPRGALCVLVPLQCVQSVVFCMCAYVRCAASGFVCDSWLGECAGKMLHAWLECMSSMGCDGVLLHAFVLMGVMRAESVCGRVMAARFRVVRSCAVRVQVLVGTFVLSGKLSEQRRGPRAGRVGSRGVGLSPL